MKTPEQKRITTQLWKEQHPGKNAEYKQRQNLRRLGHLPPSGYGTKNSYDRESYVPPPKKEKPTESRSVITNRDGTIFTQADYNRQFVAQNGSCGICGRDDRKLVLDHCHSKNVFRGLLCSNCNTAIGMLKDSVESCLSAARYLSA